MPKYNRNTIEINRNTIVFQSISRSANWRRAYFYAFLVFFLFLVLAPSVLAADCVPTTCLKCPTTQAKIICRQQTLFQTGGFAVDKPTATIPARIGIIADTFMSVVGVIFLAIMVFSGIQWMSAGGNEESVKKAKTRITRATVGLIIVIGSWAIVNFVLKGLIAPPGASSGWGPFSWTTY